MHINSQLAMHYVTVVISDASNIDILVCNYCEAKITIITFKLLYVTGFWKTVPNHT